MKEDPVEACTSVLVRYQQGGSMLYEEVGYFAGWPRLKTGTHFVFEEGMVTWDGNSWRMITNRGEELEAALPAAGAYYAPVYANMLAAIRGEE